MLKRGRMAGGLALVAAVAAQAQGHYKVLEYLTDLPPIDLGIELAWVAAVAATVAAAVMCMAGSRRATLVLASSALALNLVATASSATRIVSEGLPLAMTLKWQIFGVYPGNSGVGKSVLFAGIVTLVLLAAAIAFVATARGAAANRAPTWDRAAGQVPATGGAAPWVGAAQQASGPTAGHATQQSAPVAGWYPHPSGNGSLGYWDGLAWLNVPAPQA